MNHRDHIQAYKAKHTPPEFDDELLELINEAVKERADNRDNQGESDGRNKED